MASVKWIKIVTDVFDNRKIRQIELMPDADAILVIWFKILCLAGTVNESGLLIITKDIPYNDEMLANQFNRPVNTIRLALDTFQKFGMIERVDDVLCVSNWEKYQSVETLDRIREQTRLRVAKHREKQKALSNETSNVTVTQCNATEEDKNKNKNKKENKGTIFDDVPCDLLEPIKEFAKFRKESKKPMTKRAVALLLGKLQEMTGGNVAECEKILNQSIMNGWTSIYPLKVDKTKEAVNPFDELLRKELENEQSRNNSPYEDSERLLPDVLPGE